MRELKVGQMVTLTFENPHTRTIDRKILGIKVGERTIQYPNEVYLPTTLLVVDPKFKDVTVRALEGLCIEPVLHYDYRQLRMF